MAIGCGIGLTGLIVSASRRAGGGGHRLRRADRRVRAAGGLPPARAVPAALRGQPSLVHGAFALDSVLTELLFIAGPALTAAIAVLASPQAALGLSAVAVTVGTFAFLAALRGTRSRRTHAPAGLLGALRAPGVRTIVLTMLPVGFAFGILEITVTAFAADEGHPELAGVLLTLWACASAAGGLVYGARPRRGTASDTHLRVALLLPVGLAPVVLSTSPLTMARCSCTPASSSRRCSRRATSSWGRSRPPARRRRRTRGRSRRSSPGSPGQGIAGTIVDGPGWRTAAIWRSGRPRWGRRLRRPPGTLQVPADAAPATT